MTKTYYKKDGVTKVIQSKKLYNTPPLKELNRSGLYDCLKGFKQSKSGDLNVLNIKNYLSSLEKTNFSEYEKELLKLTFRVLTVASKEDLNSTTDRNSLYLIILSMYSRLVPISHTSIFSSLNRPNTFHIINEIPSLISIAKEIIIKYLRYFVKNLSEEELNAICEEVVIGNDPLEYITIGDMKLSELTDESLKFYIREKFELMLIAKQHICFDCGVPLEECPKIMDMYKKNIDEYDFIVDGTQTVTKGKYVEPGDPSWMKHDVEFSDELVVSKCKKYIYKPHIPYKTNKDVKK